MPQITLFIISSIFCLSIYSSFAYAQEVEVVDKGYWPDIEKDKNYIDVLFPLVLDFDNDGENEIVLAVDDNTNLDPDGRILVINPDFSYSLIDFNDVFTLENPLTPYVDKDELLFLAVRGGTNKLYLFDNKGKIKDGWPISFDEQLSTPFAVVSDLDGDGSPEIIVTTSVFAREGGSCTAYVFDKKGNVISPLYPLKLPFCGGLVSYTVSDINNDKIKEIIFLTSSNEGTYLHYYTYDGKKIDNIPANPIKIGNVRSSNLKLISGDLNNYVID